MLCSYAEPRNHGSAYLIAIGRVVIVFEAFDNPRVALEQPYYHSMVPIVSKDYSTTKCRVRWGNRLTAVSSPDYTLLPSL
jgi:hypothetical protein